MSLTQPCRSYSPWKPGCLTAIGMSEDVSPGPRSSHLALMNPRQARAVKDSTHHGQRGKQTLKPASMPAARKATEGQQPNPKSPGPYLVCIAELGHLVSMVEGLPDERRARSLPNREMPGQVGTWPGTELTFQATVLSTLALSPPIPTSVSLTKGYRAPAVRWVSPSLLWKVHSPGERHGLHGLSGKLWTLWPDRQGFTSSSATY